MSGVVVWFTGLPSSGKSTLARRVRAALAEAGRPALLLDGDDVRAALAPARELGYAPADREAFYATLARFAALFAAQELVVLVAATAPQRAHRAGARALAPRFVEVWVATPAVECARRDPKGLWAAARAGAAPDLPGAGAPYEPPEAADVVTDGGEDAVACAAVVQAVLRR